MLIADGGVLAAFTTSLSLVTVITARTSTPRRRAAASFTTSRLSLKYGFSTKMWWQARSTARYIALARLRS